MLGTKNTELPSVVIPRMFPGREEPLVVTGEMVSRRTVWPFTTSVRPNSLAASGIPHWAYNTTSPLGRVVSPG